MKKNKKGNGLLSFIISFLVVLFVALSIGFLFSSTNSFNEPLRDFSITCNDEEILSDRENYALIKGKAYTFKVSNTLEKIDLGSSDFLVNIIPNPNNVAHFEFTVTNSESVTSVNFQSLPSLNKGFSLSVKEDCFMLTVTKDLQEILELYFPASTLSNVPTAINSNIPYFRLNVVPITGEPGINIDFNIKG